MNNSNDTAKWVAKYGILVALAFLLSYVEAMIPIPIPVPGVKLGLANLVTIVGLYTVGVKGTVVISISRIILAGLTFGNLFSMIYSLFGGITSLILMIVIKKSKWFSTVGVSVIGGIGHNIGQLTFAAYVVETASVYYYLPALMTAGIVAGAVIGLVGGMIITRIQRYIS